MHAPALTNSRAPAVVAVMLAASLAACTGNDGTGIDPEAGKDAPARTEPSPPSTGAAAPGPSAPAASAAPSSPPAAPTTCPRVVVSVAEANLCFVNQWGPTPYNDPPPGVADIPWGYLDSGPTGALMSMIMAQKKPQPKPADAYLAIDAVRDAMLGHASNESTVMSFDMMLAGLQRLGASATTSTDPAVIDATLAVQGGQVLFNSSTVWSAWGSAQRSAGNYLNPTNPNGHTIVVMGKAPDGDYLVGDTLAIKGALKVTPAQLKTAMGLFPFYVVKW